MKDVKEMTNKEIADFIISRGGALPDLFISDDDVKEIILIINEIEDIAKQKDFTAIDFGELRGKIPNTPKENKAEMTEKLQEMKEVIRGM